MKNTIIVPIIVVSTFFLSGCNARHGLFFGSIGIMQANRMFTEPRSYLTIKNDYTINARVNRQLLTSSKNSEIYAITYNQVVLLLGQTVEESAIKHANDCAKTTNYVRHIFNQITLQKPISAWRRVQDALIKNLIRVTLTFTSHVRSHQFIVIVEDRAVFLLGKSTQASAESAAQAIQKLPLGIKHIIQVIEYI